MATTKKTTKTAAKTKTSKTAKPAAKKKTSRNGQTKTAKKTATKPAANLDTDFAAKLADKVIAVRVHTRSFNVRRQARSHIGVVSEALNAEAEMVGLQKHLLDPADADLKIVRNLVLRAWRDFRDSTYAYPAIRGTALIPKSDAAALASRMDSWQQLINSAAAVVQAKYADMKAEAKTRLGDLWDASAYPERVDDLFGVTIDFPNLEVGEYLKDLAPGLFEKQVATIKKTYDDAVKVFEQSMADQLSALINNLSATIDGKADGTRKAFGTGVVANLHKFFAKFDKLNIGSSQSLTDAVAAAQKIVDGVSVEDLKTNEQLATQVSTDMKKLEATMSGSLEKKGRRIKFAD